MIREINDIPIYSKSKERMQLDVNNNHKQDDLFSELITNISDTESLISYKKRVSDLFPHDSFIDNFQNAKQDIHYEKCLDIQHHTYSRIRCIPSKLKQSILKYVNLNSIKVIFNDVLIITRSKKLLINIASIKNRLLNYPNEIINVNTDIILYFPICVKQIPKISFIFFSNEIIIHVFHICEDFASYYNAVYLGISSSTILTFNQCLNKNLIENKSDIFVQNFKTIQPELNVLDNCFNPRLFSTLSKRIQINMRIEKVDETLTAYSAKEIFNPENSDEMKNSDIYRGFPNRNRVNSRRRHNSTMNSTLSGFKDLSTVFDSANATLPTASSFTKSQIAKVSVFDYMKSAHLQNQNTGLTNKEIIMKQGFSFRRFQINDMATNIHERIAELRKKAIGNSIQNVNNKHINQIKEKININNNLIKYSHITKNRWAICRNRQLISTLNLENKVSRRKTKMIFSHGNKKLDMTYCVALNQSSFGKKLCNSIMK